MNIAELNILLKRNQDTHKGKNGHVLVIAGSTYFSGAAILASVAALRIGADLVTLACPREVGIAANSYCPDIITIKLDGDHLKPSHYKKITANLRKYDVVLIGNGIGMNEDTKKLVLKLMSNNEVQNKLKVIDADALKMVAIKQISHAIFTPHKKEYEHLLKNSKISSSKQLQEQLHDNIVLLKGRIDKIISKNKISLNKTGNPGMAKAGTGDVLAGLCAGILAKTKKLQASAEAAAWLNGYLGDILLKKKKGYYYIASDLLDEIKNIKQSF